MPPPRRPEQNLAGWRVLVPRSGPWAERVATMLEERGARAVIVPLIAYEPPADRGPLDRALERLACGAYDWVVVTSAATADVLAADTPAAERARVPATTRFAAVGEASADALRARGFEVAYVPRGEASAHNLVESWQADVGALAPARILVLQSNLALDSLGERLQELGHAVDVAVAYRTVERPLDPTIVQSVQAGGIDAVLVTSGSVARAIVHRLGPLPSSTVVASIGSRTSAEAHDAGLRVHLTAPIRDMEALVSALEAYAPRRTSESKVTTP
jgi:uroporphyrinogen-III synthase